MKYYVFNAVLIFNVSVSIFFILLQDKFNSVKVLLYFKDSA